jgi:type II secretory ATPase GspE/PulE/Tfp pilus assembly ATPase PilB-like protein
MRGTVLRSLIRQDPNVIMVGEIRDEEVAKIVGQAAYTATWCSHRCTPSMPPPP